MTRKCYWCGNTYGLNGLGYCRLCNELRLAYNTGRATILHTTPTSELLHFRNACMDLQELRAHGGRRIPADVDYQLERVKRYLGEA